MSEIEAIAGRHGLSLDELRAVLTDTDAARGLLTPADLNRGLASVVEIYLRCLASAAERFEDPQERQIADRMVALTVETLAGQLQAAPHKPN